MSMTCEEMLSALRRYQETLAKWPAERCPSDYDCPGMGRQMKHARWLIDETIGRMERDETTEGDARWCLGFVQCVFWIHGLSTMAEMDAQEQLAEDRRRKAATDAADDDG